jgi:hypothetical protein
VSSTNYTPAIILKEEKTMTEFTLTDNDPEREIDLGLSQVLTVTNLALNEVKVHIDLDSNGIWSSAIKANAGYSNPFTVQPAATKVVAKKDLESEHVRVGIDGDGAKVKFRF